MIYLVEATTQFSDELEEFKQEIILYDADNEDQFAGCMGLRNTSTSEEWINICNLRKSVEYI